MQFRYWSIRRRTGTTTTERRRPSTSAPKDGEAASVNRAGRESAMLPHALERPLLDPKQPEDKGRDGTNTAAVIYIVVLVIGGIWLFIKLILQ